MTNCGEVTGTSNASDTGGNGDDGGDGTVNDGGREDSSDDTLVYSLRDKGLLNCLLNLKILLFLV